MQVSSEQLHQIWLQCMQMNQCTPQQALAFIAQIQPVLNHTLTPSKQTLLMLAASTSNINLLKAALSHSPPTNSQDSIGRTALHYAAAVGGLQAFQVLVQCGANPQVATIGGETPLSKACLFAQGDIIEWYLNNCLTAFDLKDNTDRLPLDLLKSSGQELYKEVISIFMELKAEQSG